MTNSREAKITVFIYVLIFTFEMFNIYFSSTQYITETVDTKDYYKIAQDLPEIKNSLFPILYPVILRFFNFFFNDYFLSSKIINVSILCFLFTFLYRKNFYWKEFSLLLLAFFSNIICYSWSETFVLLLLVLLLYYTKKIIEKQATSKDFIIFFCINLLGILTKYSFIYVITGELAFWFISYLLKQKISKNFFISLVLVIVFTAFYLLFNKYLTGYTTGTRSSSKAVGGYTLSISNTIYQFNPFFSRNFLGFSINWALALLPALALGGIWMKLIFKNITQPLTLYSTLCSLAYLGLLFVSFVTMRIDPLGPRLLLPFILFFYFALFTTKSIHISTSIYGILALYYIGLTVFRFINLSTDTLQIYR